MVRGPRLVTVVGVALMAIPVLVAGCSSPTQPGARPEGADDAASKATDRLTAIIGRLAGLNPWARRSKLIELAKAEGGTVNAYGSTNHDTTGPLLKKFEADTGIKTNYFRGSSSDVLQRVLQEASAGKPAADMIFRTRLTTAPPTSWEQVLTSYQGKVALEISDWDWFATLVKYFVAQKHMTEAQAVAQFRTAARNAATVVDGQPLILRPNGMGIDRDTIATMLGERKKWESLYEQIIRETGKKPVDK